MRFEGLSTAPQFSIVLPTHDRLDFLLEAVASVRGQTLDAWELIVVDDASRDGSAEAIEAIGDPRIRVIRRARNGGPSAARNVGVLHATAPWIAFLDSDDLWEPDHLEASRDALRGREAAGWCYASFQLCNADGSPLRRSSPAIFSEGWILSDLALLRIWIATSAVLVNRALFDRVGGFDDSMRNGHDYDLWYRLAPESPAVAVKRPTVRIRKHDEHERRSRTPRANVYEERVRIYERLRRSVAGAPFARVANRRIARYAATAALCHLAEGARPKAIRAARRSVRARPTYLRGWLTLARSLTRVSDRRLRRTAVSSR